MKKNIILSSLAAISLLSSTINADSLDDKIAKLELIIKAQQKQIDELKESLENKASLDDLDDVDERLEGVETKTLTDKIQLGLGMRVEANNYSNTYSDGTSYNANQIYRTKLNVNMKSKITDKMKFTGRLSMYKNWGDSTPRNYNMDSMQGRKPDSSTMYVERAYIDWIMTDNSAKIPLILTLGRQPSSDGPSYQIKEDMERKGTYDALAADGAADGIVVTANLNKVAKGMSARIAYGTPNVLDNEQYTTSQFNYNGNPKANYDKTKVTGYFLEHNGNLFNSKSLAQIYYMDAKNMNGNPQIIDPTTHQSQDKILGDFSLVGAMFEASKINGKLDLFAHYAHSSAKPNGKTIKYANQNLGLLTTASSVDAGDTSTKNGNAYWIGARYGINKDYKLGLEYNHGSQYWFSFTSGANDPLNKLATRGDAWEIYLTKKLNKYANLRLGYVDINYDYTGSGNHLGKPQKITSALNPKAIKETKNIYLNFNLLF